MSCSQLLNGLHVRKLKFTIYFDNFIGRGSIHIKPSKGYCQQPFVKLRRPIYSPFKYSHNIYSVTVLNTSELGYSMRLNRIHTFECDFMLAVNNQGVLNNWGVPLNNRGVPLNNRGVPL